jgi:DNA-binding beta-propeller fold protein YncE
LYVISTVIGGAGVSSEVIDVVDGFKYRVIAHILVPNTAIIHPSDIDVNPITNTIYWSNREANRIFVVDGLTNQIEKTLATNFTEGRSSKGLSVDYTSNLIYLVTEAFRSGAGNLLYVIDGSSNRIADSVLLDREPTGIVVNPGKSTIYITTTDKVIYALKGNRDAFLKQNNHVTQIEAAGIKARTWNRKQGIISSTLFVIRA